MSGSKPVETGPTVTRCNPEALLNSTDIGLSQISIVAPGRLAFLSGQTATPRDRGEIPPRLTDQARIVANNLAASLEELAATPHDVVMLRIYVVDATTERFEEAWSPIRDMLGGGIAEHDRAWCAGALDICVAA